MKSDNNWYGHRSIFSNYIGQKDKSSFSSIQHGYLNRFFLNNRLRPPKIKFIPYLCWNQEVKNRFNNLGFENVHIVGAPFVYLSKKIQLKNNKKNNNLLFFPPHSSIDDKKSRSDYIHLCNKLIKIYKKKIITVCLYYSDYNNKKIVNIFKKKGIKVITIVTREKNKSLENLYHEIYNNDYIVVCDISSVLFYAMFLKKKVRVLLKNNIETYLTKKIGSEEKFIFYFKKKYPELFKEGLDPKKGYSVACDHLGYRYLRSKAELKNLLGWDSVFKNFLAKILAFYYDIKYGNKYRLGKKVKR